MARLRFRWLPRGLILAGAVLVGIALYRIVTRPDPAPAERAVPRGPRSVLLVTVDTTRPDHLQPYGAEDVATPALQRLADQGIVFENAFSVAPITLVAHTSIHTGLYPPQHGVRNNGLHSVPEEVETLAERLGQAGWATAAFVSAAVLERRYNLTQGFEVYDDDLSAGRERHPRMVADRPAEATVAAAASWLDALGPDRRYFLWVHLYDPHASYSPPPPYRDVYRERLYDGEIAYMDAEIGRLLAHPRIDEDTLVAVLGDHGESLGEHGEQTHALLAYDATLRVPWILRLPGGPRGLRVAPNVDQTDLLPTLLDLVDLPVPEGVAGRSLVRLLEGRPAATDRELYAETYLPFYTYGWAPLRVLRQGRYKWIEAPEPELYDVRRDPRELADLHDQEPGLAHDLARDLAEREPAGGGREASLDLDEDALEKLRALGYLATGSRPRSAEGTRPDPKAMIDLHVRLERARFFVSDRLFPQAEAELRRVLARDPTNLAAMIDLASVLGEQERSDEAVAVAERALELDPGYLRLQLLVAGLEARRGNGARALELYDVALRIAPGSLEARLNKALELQRQRRFGDAEALLTEALAEHPETASANLLYAQLVELRRGDLAAAEARLRRALARDPFLGAGWRVLGIVLERQGRGSEALEAFREGLRRAPDDAELHAEIGLLLARRHAGAEAESHLREALRLAREARPEVRVALGGWLAEHGRFAAAEAEYEKVLRVRPDDPAARNNRAVAFYQTGRLDAAERELLELVARHPRYADAFNNLAAIAFDRGRFADAAERAGRAVALAPRMSEGWNNLGLAQAALGRPVQARASYEQALSIEPSYWQARLNLGLLLSGMGEAEAAAAALEEAVQQVPNLAEGHLELGKLYAGPLADAGRARSHLNAFLRQAPRHPEATEARRRLEELGSRGPLR